MRALSPDKAPRRTRAGVRGLTVVLFALLMNGCGGDDDPAPEPQGPPTVAKAGYQVAATKDGVDLTLDPGAAEAIKRDLPKGVTPKQFEERSEAIIDASLTRRLGRPLPDLTTLDAAKFEQAVNAALVADDFPRGFIRKVRSGAAERR